MTVRTSRKSVTFKRPFSLSGIDNEQPAGTYEVETEEELLQELSFPAYRRISTVIVLPAQPGSAMLTEIATIDPLELEAAQDRDAMAGPSLVAATSVQERQVASAPGATIGRQGQLHALAARLGLAAARMTVRSMSGRALRFFSKNINALKTPMQGDIR